MLATLHAWCTDRVAEGVTWVRVLGVCGMYPTDKEPNPQVSGPLFRAESCRLRIRCETSRTPTTRLTAAPRPASGSAPHGPTIPSGAPRPASRTTSTRLQTRDWHPSHTRLVTLIASSVVLCSSTMTISSLTGPIATQSASWASASTIDQSAHPLERGARRRKRLARRPSWKRVCSLSSCL